MYLLTRLFFRAAVKLFLSIISSSFFKPLDYGGTSVSLHILLNPGQLSFYVTHLNRKVIIEVTIIWIYTVPVKVSKAALHSKKTESWKKDN